MRITPQVRNRTILSTKFFERSTKYLVAPIWTQTGAVSLQSRSIIDGCNVGLCLVRLNSDVIRLNKKLWPHDTRSCTQNTTQRRERIPVVKLICFISLSLESAEVYFFLSFSCALWTFANRQSALQNVFYKSSPHFSPKCRERGGTVMRSTKHFVTMHHEGAWELENFNNSWTFRKVLRNCGLLFFKSR